MGDHGVTKHSLEVLTFRSVKRARDIFLTEPGAPPAPIEVRSSSGQQARTIS